MQTKIECVIVDGSDFEMFELAADEPIITNFTAGELACPTSSRIKVDKRFLERLWTLRYIIERSLVINSCCRSFSHNTLVGGHWRSLHLMDNPHWDTLGTMACDISILNWGQEGIDELLEIARDLNFSVGLANTFVHLDCRELIGLPRIDFTYN